MTACARSYANARAIAEDYPKHWRQSGGYRLDRLDPFNLAKLVCGSEGTLAVVTEATVGLVPLPKARCSPSATSTTCWRDRRHRRRARAAAERDRDDRPHDPRALARQARVPQLSETLEGDPGAAVRQLLRRHAGRGARQARQAHARVGAPRARLPHAARETAAEQDALTKVRKAGLGLLMAASEGARRPAAFVEDTAVAPSALGDYVERSARSSTATACSRLVRPLLGRLPAHPPVRGPLAAGRGRDDAAVAGEIVELVAEFDGVNSSEHGDGRARSEFNRRIFGDELYEAFRKVKALFDPQGVLNPA